MYECMHSFMPMNPHVLYFDGCCKGNPGPGGAGAVLYDPSGHEIHHESWFVGPSVTNNVAEYTGLIMGLQEAIHLQVASLHVKGDSLLVIKQMRGEYKVNAPSLLPLFLQAKELETQLGEVQYEHVYRKDNQRADALSNEGLLKKK